MGHNIRKNLNREQSLFVLIGMGIGIFGLSVVNGFTIDWGIPMELISIMGCLGGLGLIIYNTKKLKKIK